MIEEHRRDAEGLGIEFVENVMRIVSAVIAPDSRMIAPDDEMSAAIVLPYDCVKHGFSRARVAHSRGIDRQQRSSLRKVILEHCLVTTHSNIRRNVVGFRLAHQGVQQKAIDHFERALDYVLVRPVNRIPSLKSNNSMPALLLELFPGLFRIEPKRRKSRVARPVEEADGTAEQPVALIEESGNTRMRDFRGQIDPLGFTLLVIAELLAQMQHPKQMVIAEKSYVRAFRETACDLIGRRQGDRDRPWQSRSQMLVPPDGSIVVLTHEALEGAE